MMKTTMALGLVAFTAVSASPVIKRNNGIDDTTILNYALTLEHLENAFYSGALQQFDEQAFADAGLPSFARGRFQQVADHEQAHVDFLSKALGDNATKPCEYSFPYSNPAEFSALSQILEGVGVSAYAGAAQFITNKEYLTAAAVVLSTEARHASWVASAVNKIQPWSGALDTPLSLNEVYSLASGFITSCPDSNPMLPVKAFPVLTASPASGVKPGDQITLSFEGLTDGLTAVFLTGLTTESAQIGGDGTVIVPADLKGTVYVVVTKGGANVTDESTVAGPAILEFDFASNGELE